MSILLVKSGKSKGKYRVRIQPVDPLTGKKVSIPSQLTKTRSKAEAKKLEKQMWSEFHLRKKKESLKLDQSFAQAFQEFVDDYYNRGKWEESTYYDWKYTVRLVKNFFGRQKIKDVREEDIDLFAHQYVKQHKTRVAKHTTVDRQLQNLRAFFNRMRRYGLTVNPVPNSALGVFFRKSDMTAPDKKYVFTDTELSRLKNEIYSELGSSLAIYWGSRLAILIALDTGMRPQELQALKWSNLTKEGDFTVFQINDAWCERTKSLNGHLKARAKGDLRKTLPLSKETLDILSKYHHTQETILQRKGISNKNDFVLLNMTDFARCSRGLPIAQKTMNDMLKGLAKKVKVQSGELRVTMYTCRHTVATKLGNTPGMSYPWAADRLGHSLQMFMRTYVHPDRDKDQDMLKLSVL